jgi:glycosyltransferase involved in cell wall biosynthesis
MKILQAVHSFPPSQGGPEHHVYHISRELAVLGNDVTVMTSRDSGTRAEEKMAGINVRRYHSVDFSLFASARFPFGAFIAMLKENPDIYASHGYGSIMPLFASIAALIKGKPFVFTLHGYPEIHGRKRIFYHLYRFFVAPVFLRIAKKVIVVSKSGFSAIEKEVDQKKIIYIPNGIEGRFDCELNFPEKNRILFVGRLSEDKGVDILMRAFARLRGKYPDLTLKLVGEDDGEKSKLEALARSLGIQPIFSSVPYEKMPSVYAEGKAVVLPSRYEGLNLVWLEAMSSGRPMFSTPVGEANTLFDQAYDVNKELFLFKDEDELFEKLTTFLDNQEKYRKMVERAKYTVKEEYSWKNVASLTRAVYEELLD